MTLIIYNFYPLKNLLLQQLQPLRSENQDETAQALSHPDLFQRLYAFFLLFCFQNFFSVVATAFQNFIINMSVIVFSGCSFAPKTAQSCSLSVFYLCNGKMYSMHCLLLQGTVYRYRLNKLCPDRAALGQFTLLCCHRYQNVILEVS